MNPRRSLSAAAAVAASALVLPAVLGSAPAIAEAPTTTVVRKTVLITGSADGTISTNRLIVQAAASGTGSGQILVPVGSTTPRNLEGFSPTTMDGANAVYAFDVTGGEENFRSVVDNTAPVPVTVSVAVTIDGQPVAPADVLGRSGLMQVNYTIKNTTTTTQTITYEGGNGPVTEQVPISVPIGGSVDFDLPSEFTAISAPGANVAGDGSGGTKLSYSLVLFEPLGSPEATVTYMAQVENASMPAATLSFLPIIPMENSTVAATYAAYQGGAESGMKIADAGVQIGDNLIKLADGAGQLLAGLTLLSDGAAKLSAGLNDTAVPGSAQLADGAGQLSDGATQLSDGLNDQIAPGSELLSGGASALAAGVSDELVPGTKKLANALEKKLAPGAQDLADGLGQLAPGASSLSDALNNQIAPGAATLSAGVAQISAGLAALNGAGTGVPALVAGVGTPTDVPPAQTLYAGLNGVNGGLASLKTGLQTLQTGLGDLSTLNTGTLSMAAALAANGACSGDAACAATVGSPTDVYPTQTTLYGMLNTMGGGLTNASTGVTTALGAIGSSATPGNTLLYGMAASLSGLGQISTGLSTVAGAIALLAPGAATASTGATALAAGTDQAAAGADQISAGADAAAAGADKLAAGADEAATGASKVAAGADDVADGADQLAQGASDLATGIGTAADGAAQVADGAAQVADGAGTLSTGLVDAGDGAKQISDGLTQATPGASQIQDGANQLNTMGAVPLEESGKEAVDGFARDVAIIDAVNALALTGAGIPFGPSPGTTTTTAVYQFQLAGISPADQEGPVRWVLAVILILLAGGVGAVMWAKVGQS